MAKQSGLLTRTSRYFLLMAVILLSASIPVYYLVVEAIWLDELDEKNTFTALHLEQKILRSTSGKVDRKTKISWLNETNPDAAITILARPSGKKARYFTTYLRRSVNGEENDRFRVRKAEVRSGSEWFSITTLSNIEEENEIVGALALVTTFFLVVLFGGFLLLIRIISGRIWRPFYASIDVLRQFEISGDRPEELPETPVREFSELNRELNLLLTTNQQTFNNQREFLENAAHELQTPIAVLNSKIELRNQQPITLEEAGWMNELQKPLHRLNRINKNLLLLAKIGNQQFRIVEHTALEPIVQNTIDLLEDYILQKNQAFVVDIAPVELAASEILSEIAVSNLVSNAIKFSASGSKLLVELNEHRFSVSNPGTVALDENSVGKRFHKGQDGDTGLGLSIVQQICKFHNWEFSYSFTNSTHRFSIIFGRSE